MLRYFVKLFLMAWFFYTLLVFGMVCLGKLAPDVSVIAFFSQELDGTDYWRFDSWTAISLKESYSSRILVTPLDNLAFNPLFQFVAIENIGGDYTVYQVDLSTQESSYLGSYPERDHYLILEGDYLFSVEHSSGYDWTRLHIPSGNSEFFLEDTYLQAVEISPDNLWMAGLLNRDNYLFINMRDGSRYTLDTYCCVSWSPDGQWYIATHSENHEIISVLSSENGQEHPVLPQSFEAPSPYWTSDSQSILFENQEHIDSISLETGETTEYPASAQNFWIPCFSPNQKYIIVWEDSELALINIETGAELWRLNHDFTRLPDCFWSANSRYLSMYISAQARDHQGNYEIYWQRFIFVDTLSGEAWELYPENLPTMPVYIHMPD